MSIKVCLCDSYCERIVTLGKKRQKKTDLNWTNSGGNSRVTKRESTVCWMRKTCLMCLPMNITVTINHMYTKYSASSLNSFFAAILPWRADYKQTNQPLLMQPEFRVDVMTLVLETTGFVVMQKETVVKWLTFRSQSQTNHGYSLWPLQRRLIRSVLFRLLISSNRSLISFCSKTKRWTLKEGTNILCERAFLSEFIVIDHLGQVSGSDVAGDRSHRSSLRHASRQPHLRRHLMIGPFAWFCGLVKKGSSSLSTFFSSPSKNTNPIQSNRW